MTQHLADTQYDVTCPHCRKAFTGKVLGGKRTPQRGFKCPHCRLFVPYERADELAAIAPR